MNCLRAFTKLLLITFSHKVTSTRSTISKTTGIWLLECMGLKLQRSILKLDRDSAEWLGKLRDQHYQLPKPWGLVERALLYTGNIVSTIRGQSFYYSTDGRHTEVYLALKKPPTSVRMKPVIEDANTLPIQPPKRA